MKSNPHLEKKGNLEELAENFSFPINFDIHHKPMQICKNL
jgi:hypothetical protein